jgi:hypothetical protein
MTVEKQNAPGQKPGAPSDISHDHTDYNNISPAQSKANGAEPPPATHNGDLAHLPTALAPLTALPNWVVWRWGRSKAGKWTKVPFRPYRPSQRAKNNDPGTWGSYDTALNICRAAGADGIGFCLLDSEFAAFDLDKCRDPATGAVDEWARALVERVGSYTEITVSGTGLRIIGRGTGPELQRKQGVDVWASGSGGSLETYRQTERYIVMTGNPLPGSAAELTNIDHHIDEVVAELEKASSSKARAPKANGRATEDPTQDEIEQLIRCGDDGDGDRSAHVWHVCCEMLRRGHTSEAIAARLLDRGNRISDHVYDQGKPEEYAARQVARAAAEVTFSRPEGGGPPHKTQNNVRVALLKMGVTVRYDMFADQVVITGLPGFGRVFDDAAARRLRLQIDQRFKLGVQKEMFWDVVLDAARLNAFHPVRDYLDALVWDGVPRISKWLSTYGGAKLTDYTCAVGALFLLAAVRRVRQPGCKFDEMIVLECPVQGTNKSSALALLAVKDEWFSDDIPVKLHGKEVIEMVRGRWIIEAPELQNLRRDADIQAVKTFLARRYDRGRLVYDRLLSDVPRQCVFAGTTNEEGYLRDTTGNRRWWPVRMERFDLVALARDRDQLWAEAAALEAKGASIRLDEKLWPAATLEQQARLTHDPWFETLLSELGDKDASAQGEKMASASVWTILDIGGNRTQEQNARVGKAMRELGWRRANTAGTVKIQGKLVMGYVRGEAPWTVIMAERRFDKDTGQHELLVYRVANKDDAESESGGAAPRPAQGHLRLVQPENMGHADPKFDPPPPEEDAG